MCCGVERHKKETIKMKETEWKMRERQEHKLKEKWRNGNEGKYDR